MGSKVECNLRRGFPLDVFFLQQRIGSILVVISWQPGPWKCHGRGYGQHKVTAEEASVLIAAFQQGHVVHTALEQDC